MRRKRQQIQTLDFLPGFLLFFEHACSLVSSSQVGCGVRSPFGVHSKNEAHKYPSLLRFSWLMFNSCTYFLRSVNNSLSNPNCSLLPPEGVHICFHWFLTCAEDLGPPVFSNPFLLMQSGCHKLVLYPEALRGQPLLPQTHCLLFRLIIFLLSLLPQKLDFHFLYKLDLLYHVTTEDL